MRNLFASANNTQASCKPSFSCANLSLTDAALAVSVSFSAHIRVIIRRISILAVIMKNKFIAKVEAAAV